MKKFLKKISGKAFDIVCFIGGPLLAVHGLLSFGYAVYGRPTRGEPPNGPLYYPDDAKIMIMLGVTLTCIGVLSKLWRKH